MTGDRFLDLLKRLADLPELVDAPVHRLKRSRSKTPYAILVATILSSRTRDEVTLQATQRLIHRAPQPKDLAGLSEETLQQLIYPVGFYRTKARHLHALARKLVNDYAGRIPDNLEALTQLPGVGLKTANLVLSEAFGLPAICVDTHVHRICNRIGLVRTETPNETERELRKILPERGWRSVNTVLVAFGQTICQPRNPRCTDCPIQTDCKTGSSLPTGKTDEKGRG